MNGWPTMAERLSEAGATTAQILIGFGLVILLAVGSQVVAGRSAGAALFAAADVMKAAAG